LEQVRADLNAFMDRFADANQASFQLHRVQAEVWRLTAALNSWVHGQPLVWPAPSGTPLDQALLLLRTIARGQPTGATAMLAPDFPYSMSGPGPFSAGPTPYPPQEEPPPFPWDRH